MSWAADRYPHNEDSLLGKRDSKGRRWELLHLHLTEGYAWVLWAPPGIELQTKHPFSRLILGVITREEAIAKADKIIEEHQ